VQTMNNQNDSQQKDIHDLKTQVALLEKEIQHINKQLDLKELWLRGITTVVIAAAVLWFGQNAVNSYSNQNQKVNTVSESVNKGK
jgi:predicted  nucleic acid-binding Zn-ribbon protein